MKIYLILLSLLLLASCDTAKQAINTSSSNSNSSISLSNSEVVQGLKAALEQGISIGTDNVSKVDGYFGNEVIKIFFPEELKSAEQKMRDFGLGALADNIVRSFNRAAESAAAEAKPIFIQAVKEMTIQDGMNILLGENDAATQYLKKTTSEALYAKFKPVIDDHLNKTGATKYWSEAATKYNKIPLVQNKLPQDISDYLANEAMDGIFYMIQKEEERIRQDPVSRTSAILKKVFAYADENN